MQLLHCKQSTPQPLTLTPSPPSPHPQAGRGEPEWSEGSAKAILASPLAQTCLGKGVFFCTWPDESKPTIPGFQPEIWKFSKNIRQLRFLAAIWGGRGTLGGEHAPTPCRSKPPNDQRHSPRPGNRLCICNVDAIHATVHFLVCGS
jgi:hypothetical protein